MKRKLFVCLFSFIILSVITGCTGDIKSAQTTDDSSMISSASDQSETKTDSDKDLTSKTLDILIEQGENFKICSDKTKTAYQYYVIDNNGDIMDEGYYDWRGDLGYKDGVLVLEYLNGGPIWQARYYDVYTGKVSRFFPSPVHASKDLVAYFSTKGEDIILIVQNKFDPSKYYKEFTRDFSIDVFKQNCTAEFLDDNKKLKITYWINPIDDEVTETIDLNSK